MAVDEELISSYFSLPRRIRKTRSRMANAEKTFHSRSFYTRMEERDGEMTTVAFRLDREVVDHVTMLQTAEKHLEELAFKHKHFRRFWNTLDDRSKEYYRTKYREGYPHINAELDELILEEIAEIEEACGYIFEKKEPIERISFNPLEETDFEDSFSKMLEILGV